MNSNLFCYRYFLVAILSLFVFCDCHCQVATKYLNVDSIINADEENGDEDTVLLATLYSYCQNSLNVDSAMKYATIALNIAEKKKNRFYKVKNLSLLQWGAYMTGDYYHSLDYCYKALMEADSVENVADVAYTYKMMGNIYATMANTTKADEFYHKALGMYNRLGDKPSIINTLVNIADNHIDNYMYEEAFDYCQKALEEMGNTDDDVVASTIMSTYGNALLGKYTTESVVEKNDSILSLAVDLLQKAYDIAQKKCNYDALLASASYLATSLLRKVENNAYDEPRKTATLNKCREILMDEYETISLFEIDGYKTETDLVWADYLVVSGQLKKAMAFADSLKNEFCVDEEQYISLFSHLYDVYSKIYVRLGNQKMAMEYSNMSHYWQLKNRVNDYAVTATESMAHARYEDEMRRKEMEMRGNEIKLESDKKQQKIIIFATSLVLILLSFLTITLLRNSRRRMRDNILLDQKNCELERQKSEIQCQRDIITEVNQEITDSINYASNIQKAAMPTAEQMKDILGDHMLIYHPLKIVSGDFYWATSVDDIKMVVVADCTGHGVPGAFVSMLGISILNDIAAHLDISNIDASVVLNQLRHRFKILLKQNGNDEDNRDGMDLSLLLYNTKNREAHYAGAFRPLIVVSRNGVEKIEGDRMPIGSHLLDKNGFTDHVLNLEEGDVLYMFSDGITDQFGYNESGHLKKFTLKRLTNILMEVYSKTFDVQKKNIEGAISEWRKGRGDAEEQEQTDDMIVLGIRV